MLVEGEENKYSHISYDFVPLINYFKTLVLEMKYSLNVFGVNPK